MGRLALLVLALSAVTADTAAGQRTAACHNRIACEDLCTRGDGAACFAAGNHLHQRLLRDVRRATRLYIRGCDLGHGPACRRAAEAYEYGEGVAADSRAATRLLREACALGDGLPFDEVPVLADLATGRGVDLCRGGRLLRIDVQVGETTELWLGTARGRGGVVERWFVYTAAGGGCGFASARSGSDTSDAAAAGPVLWTDLDELLRDPQAVEWRTAITGLVAPASPLAAWPCAR